MAGSVNPHNEVSISYEFFPPKSKAMTKTLWKTLRTLEALNPSFVSVTYGAGGGTQDATLETVRRILSETDMAPASHLTCVGADKSTINGVADELWQSGIRHIVALRGDPQTGIGTTYTPQTGGYAYGADLVEGLKSRHDFEISVSAYPERHPESANWDAEIDNLKRKVDAGASRAITQFFFEADTFLKFQDRARDAGIDIPVVPGIMLQPNFKGIKRMADMCGVNVPSWYAALFDGLDDDDAGRKILTTSLAGELCTTLKNAGVNEFHLYTLNRSDIAYSVSCGLGVRETKISAA